MATLVATERLRFVRRHIDYDNGEDKKRGRLLSILQQYWEEENGAVIEHPVHGIMAAGEWRDVPVENE
jgi:hypothetical protein